MNGIHKHCLSMVYIFYSIQLLISLEGSRKSIRKNSTIKPTGSPLLQETLGKNKTGKPGTPDSKEERRRQRMYDSLIPLSSS